MSESFELGQMVDVLLLARELVPDRASWPAAARSPPAPMTPRGPQTPLAYLAALLEAEVQERAVRRERRRLIDARFPLLKRA